MTISVKGRRVPWNDNPQVLEPGDYMGPSTDGHWFVRPPNGATYGHLSPSVHQVVEHEDGTITVSPSILHHRGLPDEYHGYLRRGVWSLT
jgi:hypothetical protein